METANAISAYLGNCKKIDNEAPPHSNARCGLNQKRKPNIQLSEALCFIFRLSSSLHYFLQKKKSQGDLIPRPLVPLAGLYIAWH